MQEKFKTESGKWDMEEIAMECEKELKNIKIPIQRIVDVYVVRDRYVFGRGAQEYYEKLGLISLDPPFIVILNLN